ncbi:germinal center-associated signaling and motility-like protein isoform X2 [Ochotona princeps]|uniref:germinal center-associated signaling and motility-like protein isoform X2 n=1 Tax=Ochotona princeps TaxID=9978 RepID=UPI002714D86C|nr:germinal center-associated signaling and motility-like protein isoform X2 [Ochotona princeps]
MGNNLRCLGGNRRKRRESGPGGTRERQEESASEGDLQGSGEEAAAVSNQECDNGSGSEVCYSVIKHVSHGRSSLNSNDDGGYENVEAASGRVRPPREGSETEYALLRTAALGPSSYSTEPDYEVVLPH